VHHHESLTQILFTIILVGAVLWVVFAPIRAAFRWARTRRPQQQYQPRPADQYGPQDYGPTGQNW